MSDNSCDDPHELDLVPTPREGSSLDSPDEYTKSAETDLSNSEMTQILGHREKFANHAYFITKIWIGFLMILTALQFFLKAYGFGLDYKEFIAVFSTTTAAVFGFGLLVGKFLFPVNGKTRLNGKLKK